VREDRTFTSVTALDEDSRCEELARMIGGQPTASSLQTAREMLEKLPTMADTSF
jgi:DNA repair ATPase RecN